MPSVNYLIPNGLSLGTGVSGEDLSTIVSNNFKRPEGLVSSFVLCGSRVLLDTSRCTQPHKVVKDRIKLEGRKYIGIFAAALDNLGLVGQ